MLFGKVRVASLILKQSTLGFGRAVEGAGGQWRAAVHSAKPRAAFPDLKGLVRLILVGLAVYLRLPFLLGLGPSTP